MNDYCVLGASSCCACLFVFKPVGAERTHVVGFGVPLFPLHQDELRYHERDDEDEHHLGVHGFVAFVFGMHSRMFQSDIKKGKGREYVQNPTSALLRYRIKKKPGGGFLLAELTVMEKMLAIILRSKDGTKSRLLFILHLHV